MNTTLRYILNVISQTGSIKDSRAFLRILACSVEVKHLGLAWCDPNSIELSTRYFVHKLGGFLLSGSEISKSKVNYKESDFIAYGEWDQKVVPILDVKSISRTIRRFSENLDWQEVGEVDWMMDNIAAFGKQDGCTNLVEVMRRCESLDSLKCSLEGGSSFLTQKQLNPKNYREKGGIGIVIDRNGNLVWFSDGAHRLGIARHLGIKRIPICIHKIHAEAILSGVWRHNLLLEEDSI